MLCEGACVRVRLGKVWACIVRVLVSSVYGFENSGQQKRESRSFLVLREDQSGPQWMGLLEGTRLPMAATLMEPAEPVKGLF